MYIYKVTNTLNGKVLIGQTIQKNVRARWNDHISKLRKNKHDNSHFQHSWNKYGESVFKWEVINEVVSLEELNRLEEEQIKAHGSLNPAKGYNKLSGGHNRTVSNELKEKHRVRMTLMYANGWQHPLKGTHPSTETRQQMSASHKKHWSIYPHHSKNKVMTNAQKLKIMTTWEQKTSKYPVLVSPDGVLYDNIFNMRRFCREHNLTPKGMRQIVNGRIRQHKGWMKA